MAQSGRPPLAKPLLQLARSRTPQRPAAQARSPAPERRRPGPASSSCAARRRQHLLPRRPPPPPPPSSNSSSVGRPAATSSGRIRPPSTPPARAAPPPPPPAGSAVAATSSGRIRLRRQRPPPPLRLARSSVRVRVRRVAKLSFNRNHSWSVGAGSEMDGFRHTGLKARNVFARMLSSGVEASAGGDLLLEASDPAKRLCKLIISCRKASALEHELDHSGVRVTSEVAERVLERLDNAGMLAYRFFEWARRQKRGGCTHTVRSYHTVVASLAKIRQYQLMWDVVAVMRKEGVANVETFGIIMRKYARAQKFDEAVYTFNVMEKYGVDSNLAAFNSLLGALCKSKNVRKAQEIFDKMNNRFTPDAKTYSILLEGWGRAPNLPKMREVYKDMLDANCQPDIVTYGIMVDALCKTGRVNEAVCVVQDMSSRGCQPTTFIYSVLVHTYGVEMRIEDAVATFLDMEKDGIVPDVVVYNALVTAFCKVKKFDNAFRVIDDMEGHGINPNSRTWNIILNTLISIGKDDEAYRVFRRMIKRCQPDSDTYTMMIKLFCQNDKIEMALKVWKYMGLKQFLPSMHTFSVLINGLCDNGEVSQACVILEDMIEKGIRPPGSTFGKLRQLLLKEGRKDVLDFLVEKMKILIQEPLFD